MTATSNRARTITLAIAAIVVGLAAVVGGGFFLLWAFNPVGDEYVCSSGEVSGGPAPVAPGEGSECFPEDDLPRGYEADPFGNRPLSYNCDKSGFRLVVKTEGRGAGQVEECISDDTEIPAGWALRDED